MKSCETHGAVGCAQRGCAVDQFTSPGDFQQIINIGPNVKISDDLQEVVTAIYESYSQVELDDK